MMRSAVMRPDDREEVEELLAVLESEGWEIEDYHAGRDGPERIAVNLWALKEAP